MSYSFNSVWVHFVWLTKNREPLISPNVEAKTQNNVYKQFLFLGLGCEVSGINGTEDSYY